MTNLTSCPFCGGSRLWVLGTPLGDEVSCRDCGGSGPKAKTEAEARELWDQRAPISDDDLATRLDVEFRSLRPLRDALIEENRRQLLAGSEHLNSISAIFGIPLSELVKDYETRLKSKQEPPSES